MAPATATRLTSDERGGVEAPLEESRSGGEEKRIVPELGRRRTDGSNTEEGRSKAWVQARKGTTAKARAANRRFVMIPNACNDARKGYKKYCVVVERGMK